MMVAAKGFQSDFSAAEHLRPAVLFGARFATLTRAPFGRVILIDPILASAGRDFGAGDGSGSARNADSRLRLGPEHTDRNKLNILGRARHDGGSLARRTPIVEQAFGYSVAPRHQTKLTALGISSANKAFSSALPNTPAIRRSQDVYFHQNNILLESTERLERLAESLDAACAATWRRPGAFAS